MKDEHVNDISNYQKLYMQYAPMLLRFAGKFISPFLRKILSMMYFLEYGTNKCFCYQNQRLKIYCLLLSEMLV